MRWEDVQTILALARGGSLAAAGRTLGVAGSTVWRRLQALEKELQTRLFERDEWALTETGEAVLSHLERVELEMLALDRAIEGQDTRPVGVVRLTAPESLLPLLAPALVEFREAHPGIHVQGTFSDAMFDLDRREADVAVRPTLHPPESAIGRRIATVGWGVYGSSEVDREACARLPWATYTDSLARLAAVQWQQRQDHEAPALMSVNTVPAMQCVVAVARCRGLLPCFVGDADARLQRLDGPIPEAASALWVLTHADLRRTARIRRLVDHLVQALGEQRPRLEGALLP